MTRLECKQFDGEVHNNAKKYLIVTIRNLRSIIHCDNALEEDIHTNKTGW